MRIIGCICVVLLAGCKLVPPPPVETEQPLPPEVVEVKQTEPIDTSELCLVEKEVAEFEHRCDLAYWTSLWIKADEMSWPRRKDAINALGNSFEDKLTKIIFTLPISTPYQDRLRASHWLKEIQARLSPDFARLVKSIVQTPNEQILEYESAITLLSRVNTQQSQSIENLQKELEAQRKKVEELLQIEASLMDKNRSSQQ
ncbi:hypothetical protein OPS25_04840 [Alteromonas ponticola]|uniref:Uncharacterized protein n=1 Tax=Alteromonas aquimaris TaxID=2998417 RepID=A0ABT3P4Y8_9ALTE|nr:hypothetical protein [Alteromonas aquimaris]MCW8107825.1 hypothetical protein [Alteromonas aquimaris]